MLKFEYQIVKLFIKGEKMNLKGVLFCGLLSSLIVFNGCTPDGGSSSGSSDDNNDLGNCLDKDFGSDVPDWIANNFDCVQVTKSGSNYVFKTNNIPMHNSAYFDESDSRYESDMPTGRQVNPNKIDEVNYTFTIPVNPSSGDNVSTDYNAIGVAIDGLVFFNNQAAAPDTLSNEVATLDNGNGHPTDIGAYHYHIEPLEITDNDTKLIGILRDGYAVFGKKCPSTNTAPSDLDSNNGHTADTGITGLDTVYHYHLGVLSGDGVDEEVITDTYYGSPGSMSIE